MKRIILAILIAVSMYGCGKTRFSGGDYVMVSKGEADGLAGIVTGGASYCKVATKGDIPDQVLMEVVKTACPEYFSRGN